MKTILLSLLISLLVKNSLSQDIPPDYSFAAKPIIETMTGMNRESDMDVRYSSDYFLNVGAKFNFNYKAKLKIDYMPQLYMYQNFNNCVTNDYLSTGNNAILNSTGKNLVTENDFNMAMSNTFRMAYLPYNFLKLELANAKNFIGNGYRSLFLSKNARNYPFFKLETEFAFIKYSYIMAMNNGWNVSPAGDADKVYKLENKYSTFHYLDFAIGRKINVGIYEAVISKNLTWDYFNPVIFFRPVEFSLGGEDNVLLGVNLKYKFFKDYIFYSQFLLDDIVIGELLNDIKHSVNRNYVGKYGWFANKWGLQFGVKSDNFVAENLAFFTEINVVRPYVYTHSSVNENYTHHGQALAHPLGANFVESISGIGYEYKNLRFDTKFMYAITGKDTPGANFGQNIFLAVMDAQQDNDNIPVNTYENTLLQGERTTIIAIQPELSYIINKRDMSVNLGYIFRHEGKNSLNFVYLGFRWNISKFEMMF